MIRLYIFYNTTLRPISVKKCVTAASGTGSTYAEASDVRDLNQPCAIALEDAHFARVVHKFGFCARMSTRYSAAHAHIVDLGTICP